MQQEREVTTDAQLVLRMQELKAHLLSQLLTSSISGLGGCKPLAKL